MKISVLCWCYSRQEMLDHTLFKWLNQEGVDYEVVVGHGPDISITPYAYYHGNSGRMAFVETPRFLMCESYNKMAKAATGDIFLITQCDMEVNSPTQLKRMAEHCNDRTIVTERFFKDGKRDIGLFAQCLMVTKARFLEVGGFCELYDNPESAAHEDADLVCSLLEHGMDIKILETPEDEGVYHIHHPRPDYAGDPVMVKRIAKGREIFNSRHKEGIMALYAKQIVRNQVKKRI